MVLVLQIILAAVFSPFPSWLDPFATNQRITDALLELHLNHY